MVMGLVFQYNQVELVLQEFKSNIKPNFKYRKYLQIQNPSIQPGVFLTKMLGRVWSRPIGI